MEMTGMLLDVKFFQKMSRELTKRLAEIEKQIYDAVGKPFNINSTQQLSDVLFRPLELEAARPREENRQRALTPPPRMCSRNCAASTRWWT